MLERIRRALGGADRRRDKQNEQDELRELLFADDVLARHIAERDTTYTPGVPQSMIAAAAARAAQGDRVGAERELREVLLLPQAESRIRLVAWHMLRGLGARPGPPDAQAVEGAVIEVMLPQGLDVLAAYRDHTARFLSHGGSVIVWEATDPKMDPLIDALLAAAEEIARRTGTHEGPRPGKPARGAARINVLARGGLHYGEGPFEVLAADPLAGPAIHAGTALMQALIERAGQKR